jgi:hypothetical protein
VIEVLMSLREASGVVWETIRDWYHSMIGLAALNLLWVSLSLTLVLLPPATAGVYTMTHSIAQGKGQQWPLFWIGVRRYGWISARWAVLNGAVVAVFVVNFLFYGATESALGMLIEITLAAGGLLWLATQFYFWPFMLAQEQKQVRVALKNALFLTLAEPLYTSVMLSTAALAVAISVILMLPLAVFVLSFIALLANRAVIERLTMYGKLPDTGPPIHMESNNL